MKNNLNVPTVYSPKQVVEISTSLRKEVDGKWVPARPLGWQGWSLSKRLRAAWMVFTGRWDALRWEGQ